MNLNKLHNDIHEGALQLIAEHRVHLMTKARSLCDSEDEAEELVVRTIDLAVRKINTYVGKGDILAWMISILVNLHNHDFRNPVVRGTKAVDAAELERCAGADWGTDEQILRNSDSEAIRRAIAGLDPKHNKVLMMRYYDELSMREIANVLRIPLGTVTRRVQIAHRLLAGKLRVEFGRVKKTIAVLAMLLSFAFLSAAAVVTVPALAPVRSAVTNWFAGGDDAGTGIPPVQVAEGPVPAEGTGSSLVQTETVSKPRQEDATPIQPNTTVTKENTMNIKKIAAVASATLVGLSSAYPNQAMASSEDTPTTFVWKGAGTTAEANRWSVGANWEGGVAPTADDIGCVISIPAAAQGSVINNDIANLQVGDVSIAAADGFTLAGEPLALTATGTFSSTTPDFRCEMPFVLAEGAANSFSIATGLTNTFAADTLRGKGGLKKIGDGRMILEGDNSFEGDLDLTAGYVTMTTANALGTWWKTVRIGYSYGNAVNKLESSSALKLTQAINFNYNLNPASH